MATEYVLEAVHLTKSYHPGRKLFRTAPRPVTAVENVSLALPRASTLAITGPSGSGKSTLARCLACLERPDSGDLVFDGQNVSHLSHSIVRQVRRQVQLVPQGSATSLNPSFTALEAVREPLDITGGLSRHQRDQHAFAALDRVGLCKTTSRRRTDEFSGGQRQRLALARALTIAPRVLILDESLTGLDMAVRAEIVNLLLAVQEQFRLACIFISHDEDLITEIADHTLMIHKGRIVETTFAAET